MIKYYFIRRGAAYMLLRDLARVPWLRSADLDSKSFRTYQSIS